MSVLVVSAKCGLVETIPNAMSLHQLYKHAQVRTIAEYFKAVITPSFPGSLLVVVLTFLLCFLLLSLSDLQNAKRIKNGTGLFLSESRGVLDSDIFATSEGQT